MIRIDLGAEVAAAIFEYSIPSLGVSGRSRQPLLDGCRAIKRMLGETKAAQQHAGLYRSGRTDPDLHCSVIVGAEMTVAEPAAGRIHFSKFQKFDGPAIGLAVDTTTATAEAAA